MNGKGKYPMSNDTKKLRLKEAYNNVFDTSEILWLLKGNESLSALAFVCNKLVGIAPEHLMDAFEYEEEK